jgi:hypothetical protein
MSKLAHTSKGIAAVRKLKEAKLLRASACGIETAKPPDPLQAEFMRYDADVLERDALEAIVLASQPLKGAGGELVPRGDQLKRGGHLIDTVERPDAVTAEASMDRLNLADEYLDAAALAVDAAETIKAENSIEKMLAHQLAAAHKLAMTFAGKAKSLIEDEGDSWSPEKALYASEAAKVANSSAKMMDAYQKGVLALHKLRTGGKQVVTVQHVNVNDGGQAVVTGGINSGGGNEK